MVRIQHLFLLPVFFLIASVGYAQWEGLEIETEDRGLSGFKEIVVRGSADVYVMMGNKDEVLVELESSVITMVEDQVLTIRSKRGKRKKERVDGGEVEVRDNKKFGSIFNPRNWFGNNSPKVFVTINQVDAITVSGAGNLKGENLIRTEKLRVNCSGASDVVMEVDAKELNCHLSGASDIRLSGTVEKVNLAASGASDFKSKKLIVQECDAKASGASDVFVYVEKRLTYRTSGASDIHFEGNPVVHNLKEKSGKPRP